MGLLHFLLSWCTHTHTHRHTEGLVCWYELLNKINPFHWVAQSYFNLFIVPCHVIDLFIAWSYTDKLCLYQSVINFFCLYQSSILLLFVYRIHQRPRGGERLAGRYNAEERLWRLLRPGRCAGRVRSVGISREGRGSSRCRAADSGRAAASTLM